jgi:hypothetical protein
LPAGLPDRVGSPRPADFPDGAGWPFRAGLPRFSQVTEPGFFGPPEARLDGATRPAPAPFPRPIRSEPLPDPLPGDPFRPTAGRAFHGLVGRRDPSGR